MIPLPSRPLRSAVAVVVAVLGTVCLTIDVRADDWSPSSEQSTQVDIPAGALGTALATFATRLQTSLSFDPVLTRGKYVEGLRGRFTVDEGFRTLLASTDLEVVPNGQGGYLLRRMPKADLAARSDPDLRPWLPKVRVESAAPSALFKSTNVSTRTDTARRDVPQSYSRITQLQIEQLSLQSLSAAVEYVPGVSVAQGEGNRETLIFRGSNTSTDFFVDGLRDDAQYYRDLYNVEQIDVLRGSNAMIFGRGGGGGVLNRVTKVADFDVHRQAVVQLGTFDKRRVSLDVGQAMTSDLAFRVNAVYEDSGSYRDGVSLQRYGVNPTVSVRPGPDTRISASIEYFHDERTADRGVSSFRGRPLNVDAASFFGDPSQSWATLTVKAAGFAIEHELNDAVVLRSQARYADYDKYFQNVFPGAVRDAGANVLLSAHNSYSQRRNLLDRTDLTVSFATGALKHELLTGLEVSRQEIDNVRGTGYFDSIGSGVTSIIVPVAYPRSTLPVSFRPSSADADNHSIARSVAGYLQLQTEITPRILTTLGLRYEQVKVDFTNHRTGERLRTDDLPASPRIGVTLRASDDVSIYANYSTAYQLRAGEQFMSLTASSRALEPEAFRSYEVGAKWDIDPALSFTAALYQLTRTNVAVADAQRLMLVDGQRGQGAELDLVGDVTSAWSIIAAYAFQRGEILKDQSTTVRQGAELALLPRHAFSLWNRYDFNSAWGAGVGLIARSDALAATENLIQPESNVTLPGYARLDAALFWRVNDRFSAQVNVENVTDKKYFIFAHSNTNITPGSPRALRVSVVCEF